ncbi:MAG: FxsA family protein [Pseudomonadota bacterium]|nr:FxsA family protein [Pseudomonadota bacterium]
MKQAVLLGLALFVAEILLWYGVAQFISGWWIFFWTVAAIFIGLNIVRSSMANVMPQMQQMQAGGAIDPAAAPQVTNALPKILVGFLLFLPGLFTDLLAALILIPAVQKRVQAAIMKIMMQRQEAMMQQMMKQMGGNPMGGGAGGFDPQMMEELMRQMGTGGMGSAAGGTRPTQGRPTIIEGEARQVTPEIKKIKSANDD